MACAWDGQTYIIDHNRSVVRFQFDENVNAFCAGEAPSLSFTPQGSVLMSAENHISIRAFNHPTSRWRCLASFPPKLQNGIQIQGFCCSKYAVRINSYIDFGVCFVINLYEIINISATCSSATHTGISW